MPEPVLDLPDAAARELYRAILAEEGRIHIGEICPEDEATVKRLADLGLTVLRVADSTYSAVSPRAVGDRVGADLREESARLLVRSAEAPDLLEDLTQAHDQVGRLLAKGLTQRAIASRTGLSERTVAGHIARLRDVYDAETLFQLGRQKRGARTGESGG
ncbi:LuxR C-terminal-related transcriptional regulator [Kitasatospora sp. NPDC127059]|uniref:helix-turn-helix transcriptional regulator n=1 Tax=unclassified Kitasatospora TaxID=2633591 RepID=UPI003652FAAB